MTLALFDMDERACRTCGGDLPRQPRYRRPLTFCSYWCALVEHGPAFYTLESITPWLIANRNRKRAA